MNFIKPLFDWLGIEHTPNIQKVLHNTAWMTLDNGLRFVVGLAVISCMAQYLGPSDFGLLNYALALVSIFTLLANLGLNEMLVRQLVTHPSRQAVYVTTAFLLRCLSGSLSFFLCLALVHMLPLSHDERWLVAVIAVGLFFQSFDVIDSYFQSKLQSKFTVLAKIFVFLGLSGIRIYLVHIKAGLAAFAEMAAAEIALGGLGLWAAYRMLGHSLLSLWDSAVAGQLLKTCWPICLAGFAGMANMRAGQILLFHLSGGYEAGIYAAAGRIIEMWSMLGYVLIASAFPIIVKLKNEDEALYRRKRKQFYHLLFMLGLVISLGTVLLARPIIALLFGQDYQETVPVLLIYIFSVPFIFLGGATTYVLVVENLQPYQLGRTVLGLAVNILLSLVLIPLWHAWGAALATLAAFIVNVYGALIFRPARKIF